MPIAAQRPCSKPGCGALTDAGRCPAHRTEAWGKKPEAPKRITGRRLQALRDALFRAFPLCAECLKQGRVVKATARDHIKSLGEGGTDTEDNVQALCKQCHDVKSKQESLRARW